MEPQLTQAVRAFLAGNRGPDGKPPDYGVTAARVPDDDRAIQLTLVFKRGRRYCCAEPGCHLGLFESSRWDQLRNHLREAGVSVPSPLAVRVRGIVEEGAFLDCLAALGAETASKAYQYEVDYLEGQTGV
jgi:hypothetical protein